VNHSLFQDDLPPTASSARLLDLLVSRATAGLTQQELRELEALQRKHPEIDESTIDHAAAAIDVELHASSARFEPMPDSVRARLAERAALWCRTARHSS